MLKKMWRFISNRHLSEDMTIGDTMKAKILNQYSFITPLFFLVDAVRDLFFGLTINFYVLASLSILFLALFFFTKIRFNDRSVFIVMLICSGIIFLFSSSERMGNGLSMYYFVIILASIFLFYDKGSLFYGIAVYVTVLTLFCVETIYDFQLINFAPADESEIFYRNLRLNTFIQVSIFMVFNGYFIALKNQKINDLHAQNKHREDIINALNEKLSNTENQSEVENLVKLAMMDDISFLTLFKQVFPDFHGNLSCTNPNLTIDEFKFCALMKLGFTTKDIAMYQNLTVRSVQTRKNRLRKSFQIASEEDLYAWVEKF